MTPDEAQNPTVTIKTCIIKRKRHVSPDGVTV